VACSFFKRASGATRKDTSYKRLATRRSIQFPGPPEADSRYAPAKVGVDFLMDRAELILIQARIVS